MPWATPAQGTENTAGGCWGSRGTQVGWLSSWSAWVPVLRSGAQCVLHAASCVITPWGVPCRCPVLGRALLGTLSMCQGGGGTAVRTGKAGARRPPAVLSQWPDLGRALLGTLSTRHGGGGAAVCTGEGRCAPSPSRSVPVARFRTCAPGDPLHAPRSWTRSGSHGGRPVRAVPQPFCPSGPI